MQLGDAAIQYAKLGWHIFPCCPGKKTPYTKHGVKDATTNLNQIQNWWRQWPDANIGLACGEKSGIYVVDIDVNDIVDGWKSLEKLIEKHGPFDGTIRQDTPRGGAHFLFRGTIPPGNKNSLFSGIDIRSDGYYILLTPSIHPNGKQYEWHEGSAPWECRPSEFPEFFRPPEKKSIWIDKNTAIPTNETNNIIRARAYLSECDPAIQGQAGHSKLLWAAVSLVHGFLLTDSQALTLLRDEYNPRCEPPWDLNNELERKDFERKVTEARKLVPEHESGWLLKQEPKRGWQANIDKIIKEAKKGNKNRVLCDNEWDFLVDPPGLVGEICQWVNRVSIRKQPFLTLGATLAFCGALFGRKVRTTCGLRTNIYCMGLGSSSCGKNSTIKHFRKLVTEVAAFGLLAGDKVDSDSGIEEELTRNPSTAFFFDEIGHFFVNIKGSNNAFHKTIVPMFMKLYSAAESTFTGKSFRKKEDQRTLIQPCCCIWGTSDEDTFKQGLSPAQISNGWLGRCLLFRTRTKPKKTRGIEDRPPPAIICNQVKAWWMREIPLTKNQGDLTRYIRHIGMEMMPMPPNQIVVPATEEAEAIFIELDDDSRKEGARDSTFEAIWDKAEENARKIALIIAAGCSYDNPVITKEIADYSCRLIRYIIADFLLMSTGITHNYIDKDKCKIVSVIRKFGSKGCDNRELTKKTQWLRGRRERNAFIDDLIEAGEIIARKDDEIFRYWTVDNFIK